MLYKVKINGLSPIIHHSAAGLDPKLPANIEKDRIAKKRGGNRTASDDARLSELETLTALWLSPEDKPEIPAAALRKTIESGAPRLRQGPMVRGGLMVLSCDEFEYDIKRYGKTLKKLQKTTAFTVPVVVPGRGRIMRTRAKFDIPWSATFSIEVYDDEVGKEHLEQWLSISGRAIGLGDWRPEKSGAYGRFELISITEAHT